jgi:hypothetical protein
MDEQKNIVKEMNLPPIPKNLWDMYKERLDLYNKQRQEIQTFIKDNLKKDYDFGKSYADSKRDTLLKPGAEKIASLIECRIKLYPDYDSWNMLGKKPSVCYVGYLINQELLKMILQYLMKVGMQYEQQVVKLFAWGEGRGAYEFDEKTYSTTNKPLKGSANRAVKMAEKRCKIDLIIGTLGLDFSNDGEEYGKDGQLRGDQKYEDDKKSNMEDITKLPEANKAIYQQIMMVLNNRHNKVSLFEEKEKVDYVKNANIIKNDLPKLQDFHETLHSLAMQRIKKLEDGGQNEQH